VHVPLTFLTDKGCLLKDKLTTSSTQDVLSIDNLTGRILATSKPLSDDGELDMTFDEWHQAWRRLLDLIKTFIPDEFLMWEVHYSRILNNENRAELWPVYLAYDAEIRKRTTQLPLDPSEFSIGIWNDLETRYTAKKVLSLVQADLKHHPSQPSTSTVRNPGRNSSFRSQSKCIFCGDTAKDHVSRNCPAPCNVNGTPCFLSRQGPSGARRCKAGKSYCFAWNGIAGCEQGTSCRKGEHSCTLCGSKSHTAQKCNIVV
jgi:hypothetical protein